MKTLNLIILFVAVAFNSTRLYSQVGIDSTYQPRILQDSTIIPHPEKDQFMILTSDTVMVYVQNPPTVREGIVCRERIYENDTAKIPACERQYEFVYRSRNIWPYFLRCKKSKADTSASPYTKVVLPKTFLQKIKPMDFDEILSRVKNAEEWYKYLDTLNYGENVKQIEKLRESGASAFEVLMKGDNYRKRIWLIDRRYITADSITLFDMY